MDNMKRALLTTLRNAKTSREEFRRAANNLSLILAQESAEYIASTTIPIRTPLGNTEGIVLSKNIIVVPILRSGATMVQPFLQYYPTAIVGVLGMKRNEQTAIAATYYE